MLAANPERGLTSREIARSVNTNPVVIRRLLSSLRASGLIATRQGAGAGSRLARAARRISLAEVYRAVEKGDFFSVPPHLPNKRCPIGKKMQSVLDDVFRSAEAAWQRALERQTIADLLETTRPAGPGKKSGRGRQAKAV